MDKATIILNIQNLYSKSKEKVSLKISRSMSNEEAEKIYATLECAIVDAVNELTNLTSDGRKD